jgi:hypothetical protein
MKKKMCLVLVLFSVVAEGVFAQSSIDGAVSTNFNGITPSIGMGLEFSNIDLLAGLNFDFYQRSIDRDNVDSENNIGIYAGLAPKAPLLGDWSLSFPMLARIRFGKIDSNYSNDVRSYFGFDFRVGARADFAFSDHWSLYTGFLTNLIWWSQNKYDNNTEDYFYIFSGGVVQFGIIYRFDSSGSNTKVASGNNTRESLSGNEEDGNNLGNQNNTQRQSREVNQSRESRQPREQVSIPQLGEPNLLQLALNQLPSVPIAGNNLKFEFGGDGWIANVNGQNFLAGNCIFEKNDIGYILTLKTTNAWSGAVEGVIDLFQKIGVPIGSAAGPLRTAARLTARVAKWIPFNGSSIILEYNEGPSASLRLGSR